MESHHCLVGLCGDNPGIYIARGSHVYRLGRASADGIFQDSRGNATQVCDGCSNGYCVFRGNGFGVEFKVGNGCGPVVQVVLDTGGRETCNQKKRRKKYLFHSCSFFEG